MHHKKFLNISSVLFSTILCGLLSVSSSNIAYSATGDVQKEKAVVKLMQQQDYGKALVMIAALSPELQQRFDTRFYRATALAGSGKNDDAIGAFKKLIEQKPGYPELYNNLAMLLVEEGKLLEAQQTLEQGLRSNESYAMLYNNLTTVFETMARRSYARALSIGNEQSPVLTPLLSLNQFTPPVPDSIPAKPAIIVAAAPAIKSDINTIDAAPTLSSQIEAQLRGWGASWQNKDIAGYIDSYSANFKSRAYRSHQEWLKGRSDRIRRAEKIDISIDDISINVLTANRVQADFVLDYYSARYSDRSKKRVVFLKIDGSWKIVRELTLKVLS